MAKLIPFLIGAGVGYVFGTKAGEERYDQISRASSKVWHSDVVQDNVDKAKAAVSDAGSQVAEKVTETAKSKFRGNKSDEPTLPTPPSER